MTTMPAQASPRQRREATVREHIDAAPRLSSSAAGVEWAQIKAGLYGKNFQFMPELSRSHTQTIHLSWI